MGRRRLRRRRSRPGSSIARLGPPPSRLPEPLLGKVGVDGNVAGDLELLLLAHGDEKNVVLGADVNDVDGLVCKLASKRTEAKLVSFASVMIGLSEGRAEKWGATAATLLVPAMAVTSSRGVNRDLRSSTTSSVRRVAFVAERRTPRRECVVAGSLSLSVSRRNLHGKSVDYASDQAARNELDGSETGCSRCFDYSFEIRGGCAGEVGNEDEGVDETRDE